MCHAAASQEQCKKQVTALLEMLTTWWKGPEKTRTDMYRRAIKRVSTGVKCNKTIKAGISPIVCSACPNLSYAGCTKITRNQI